MLLAAGLVAWLMSATASAGSPETARPVTRPEVRSHAFYVLDETDGSVLAARHAQEPAPIASITKLMTALVVLEAGQPLDERLTITSEDVRGTAGSGSRLAPGARMTRADMLRVALMSSENRAAHSLCRNYPGGLTACVGAMNDKAAALGMSTARFVEPTGLSSRNVASAEDLAKLVLAASSSDLVREYSTDPAHTVYVSRQPLEFRNTNRLVNNPGWQVNVQEVVIVLLNSFGTLTRIADAKRIRNWMESRSTARSG